MKTINISTDLTTTAHMFMAFPTKFTKTGDIKATTATYKCREQLISTFITAIKNNKLKKNLDKARIIVFGLKKTQLTDDNLKKVITPLRIIEKEIGIPRTRMVRIKTKGEQETNSLMFEGSIKWYRSSHTMSLWLMILRTCLRDSNALYGQTFKDILEKAEKFPVYCGTNGDNFEEEDKGYICETIHTWIPLMKNINKIFPSNVPWKARYNHEKIYTIPVNGYSPAISHDGIYSLACGNSPHNNAYKFKELVLNKE